MNRSEALLHKARRNPNGLKFREFERLMRRCGWAQHRQRGSHRTWYSPEGYRIIVQPEHSMAKGYQVRQFLRRYNEEAANEKE